MELKNDLLIGILFIILGILILIWPQFLLYVIAIALFAYGALKITNSL